MVIAPYLGDNIPNLKDLDLKLCGRLRSGIASRLRRRTLKDKSTTEGIPSIYEDFRTDHAEHGPRVAALHWQEKLSPSATVSQAVLLSFSDQQLVTGPAICAAAFARLHAFSQYHFEIAMDLAFLSLNIHSCTIHVLSPYFLTTSPYIRAWRILWITAETVLLLIATVWQANGYYLENYGSPIGCITTNPGGIAYPAWLAGQFIVLLWSYLRAIDGFFPQVTERLSAPIQPLLRFLERLPDALVRQAALRRREMASGAGNKAAKILLLLQLALAYGLALMVLAAVSVVTSVTFDLLRALAITLYTIYTIFSVRSEAPLYGLDSSTSVWGFGQSLAVFMLATALFTVLEATVSREDSSRDVLPDNTSTVSLAHQSSHSISTVGGVSIPRSGSPMSYISTETADRSLQQSPSMPSDTLPIRRRTGQQLPADPPITQVTSAPLVSQSRHASLTAGSAGTIHPPVQTPSVITGPDPVFAQPARVSRKNTVLFRRAIEEHWGFEVCQIILMLSLTAGAIVVAVIVGVAV